MSEKRKIVTIVILFVLLLAVGIIGYGVLLDIPLIDALYMTIITISTVGYGEVKLMTNEAKLFSIIIIFWGVGIVGYSFTTLMVNILEGKIKDMWRDKRMDNAIAKLKDHYILCGDGQTGETIIEQFIKRKQKFVVIEKDETKYKSLTAQNILAIFGDATDEKILNQAQIEAAKGLISALSSDTENIVTVLTARYMNKDLNIISRAIDKNSPEKLIKAGANNTISSSEIGGRRMAALMLRPTVISFLDVITHAGDVDLDLEDVTIHADSFIVGKSLRDAKIPDKTGLTVLAVKKSNTNQIMFNPNPNEAFEEHDVLMVLGTDVQINKLRQLAARDSDKQ